MKAKRRGRSAAEPDLFSDSETSQQRALRIAAAGNYATRTIRRWILADPTAIVTCRKMAACARADSVPANPSCGKYDEFQRRELGQRLSAWFAREVRLEEPSATYADYLTGSIEVEWGMLADELLTDAWPEGP